MGILKRNILWVNQKLLMVASIFFPFLTLSIIDIFYSQKICASNLFWLPFLSLSLPMLHTQISPSTDLIHWLQKGVRGVRLSLTVVFAISVDLSYFIPCLLLSLYSSKVVYWCMDLLYMWRGLIAAGLEGQFMTELKSANLNNLCPKTCIAPIDSKTSICIDFFMLGSLQVFYIVYLRGATPPKCIWNSLFRPIYLFGLYLISIADSKQPVSMVSQAAPRQLLQKSI